MRPSERFVWGKIVEEWEIGLYHIAKYQPFKTSGCQVDDTKPPAYHVWVDGQDTNESTNTLEGAMLLAIANKTMGRHPRGLDMIARALKLPG
jgi:hypothetical protein